MYEFIYNVFTYSMLAIEENVYDFKLIFYMVLLSYSINDDTVRNPSFSEESGVRQGPGQELKPI